MDYNDILYKNALYFKENILPFTFIIVTKRGHIVIRSSKSDFFHLVGGQHTTNLQILRMHQKNFYENVLSNNIRYFDLLNTTAIDNLDKHQKYIHLKNTIFISLFESFINRIKIKHFNKNHFHAKSFYTDYYHYDGIYNELNEIIKLNVLGIVGQTSNSYFCFNSIMQVLSMPDIENYLKEQDIEVIDAYSLSNGEFDNYLKENKSNIINSQHALFTTKKPKKKTQKKQISNKDISKINAKIHKNLSIKCGMYGKNSIQLLKDNSIIETNLQTKLSSFKTIDEIIKYINKNYK
ncbi:MAG: hypothetical protein DBY41_07455 [Clostridium sp.]|nr:MAG: hypothetical protein DBY41_07455 [Clostridium sp.]